MPHPKLLLVVALLGPASVAAQSPHEVRTGDRIRVTMNQPSLHRISGTLTQLSPDSMVLTGDSTTVAFATTAVMKLEISRGTHRAVGRRAWQGALVGFVIGTVLVLASDNRCFDCVDSDGGGILALGYTTAIGTLFGVAVGSVTVEDRWETVK